MLGRLRNSFVEIDLTALEQNFLALKEAVPGGALAPMIKADGYGHGDIQVGRVCERLGARFLGVALIEEGIKLRLAGLQSPILVFCHFDSVGAEAMVKYRLTPVLSDFGQIPKLKSVLHDQAFYPVHAKFNTGMQRLGFDPSEASAVADELGRESYLKLEGACTHFASSEDYGRSGGVTAEQIKIFARISEDIKRRYNGPVLFHYMNSAAILSGLQPSLDLARPGIALYGALPGNLPDQIRVEAEKKYKPVMGVKSFIGFVHKIKKGVKVSYGGTWQAKKESVIAVVPLGYADGLPRSLSNKGRVLVGGEYCPIAGIICMDYVMVDVTEVATKHGAALLGEEVVFIGRQQGKSIRVEDVAQNAGTISYEILTGMRSRMARVFIH